MATSQRKAACVGDKRSQGKGILNETLNSLWCESRGQGRKKPELSDDGRLAQKKPKMQTHAWVQRSWRSVRDDGRQSARTAPGVLTELGKSTGPKREEG